MALFRRRTDALRLPGVPLEPGDRRIEKLAFITRRAKSAAILRDTSYYHVVAEDFMGIPGTVVITYEHVHRKDCFVKDLVLR